MLPNIGEGIARVIVAHGHTGRSQLLERLRTEVDPSDVFKDVSGIGDELAKRVATELDISMLVELEQAAYDGRLRELEGFGADLHQTFSPWRGFRDLGSTADGRAQSEPRTRWAALSAGTRGT